MDWEPLLRLLLAAALGASIGFEREINDQPAGFRTHLLVSLGAAMFTVAGAYGFEGLTDDGREMQFDPTRVAAQVVTGIGFLGAGAIIQRGLTIRGLTTAASLWVTAAIGLAAGSGYWEGAVATTTIALVALYGLKLLQKRVFPLMMDPTFHLSIEATSDFDLSQLESAIRKHGATIRSMKFRTTSPSRQRLAATLDLGDEATPNELARDLSRIEGVGNVDWRD